MKKNYLLLSLLLLTFTSCFEDEGYYGYDYKDANNITIEGIEKYYLVYSYMGEKLEVPVTVQTGATDLEYAWYIWDVKRNQSTSGEEMVHERVLIGTDKDLSYEVNLPPKNYKLMLEVKNKQTGYTSSAITDVEVSTTFLRGFYVLKETAEGNTELDFHYKENTPNVLAATGQGAMEGKPVSLGICYAHGFADPETNEVDYCNTLAVTTDRKEIAFYNTANLVKLHDNSDVVYGGLEPGETPYFAFNIPYANCFLSNRGITISYPSGVMESFGTFGTQSGDGASVHATPVSSDGTVIYWSQERQCMDYAFGMWMGHDGRGDYKNGDFPTEGMECLMMGASLSSTTPYSYSILKDQDGKQYLYETDVNKMQTVDRVELEPDSKLANATCYATNMWTASYLYYVYNNKLYAYNLTDRSENNDPLKLEGIGENEQITYLSYMYMRCYADRVAGVDFTHLVVGTQNGDSYKVYMYDIAGGEPKELVRTMDGKGKLHSVKYVTPQFETNMNGEYKSDHTSI